MQGLQWSLLLAVAMTWSVCANAQHAEPDRYTQPLDPTRTTERVDDRIAFTSSAGLEVRYREIHVPDASFVKVHFSRFVLPSGITVEVRDPLGKEIYRYSADKRDAHTFDRDMGDDGHEQFSAMSISGATAIVRILGDLNRFDPAQHQLEIDSYLVGDSLTQRGSDPAVVKKGPGGPLSNIESTCGSDDREDAICYKESYPGEYDRSLAVVLVITSRGTECTAWRVGSSNRLFTAEHCIGDQSELDGAEIWFNYMASSCESSQNRQEVKVSGGELLTSDHTLDYALFTVNDFPSISHFGHLGLAVSGASTGEGIFIPQHGLGMPRQLAVESDMNNNGLCQVDDDDFYGYAPGSDLGYFCDTVTSSSGSPVISNSSGRVIALHHLGGCFNSGSKISLIWPQVASYFGGEVPDGDIPWEEFKGETNEAPRASFDFSCDAYACSLDGSPSSDPDGTIESYSWLLDDGSSASGQTIEHEYYEEGDYRVTLTVTDDKGQSDSRTRTVSIEAPNTGPEARFSSQCIDTECGFDASGSSDADGTVVSWNWSLGDGSSATGESIEHAFAEGGSYTVKLTVKDDDGASDSSSHTITLSEPNKAPTAYFEISCTELDCDFDASNSSDQDGTINSYSWTFGDGDTASGLTTTHRYGSEGSFSVTLTVEDDAGETDSFSSTVSVEAANIAPEASLSFNCDQLTCSFDGAGSQDADGSIASWDWAFSDGGSASGQAVDYTFKAEGSYSVTLTVTDNEGAKDSRTRSVTTGQENAPPEASFNLDCTDNNCTFDASASRDSDGSLRRYSWSFGDGSSGSGEFAEHSYASEGRFTVTLVVEDNEGATDERSRTAVVTPANDEPVADFTYSCSNKVCELDGGSSTDSDDGIAQYDWDFGDGFNGTGRTVVHEYARGGDYIVRLKVTDKGNSSGVHARTVKVKAPELELSGALSLQNVRTLAKLQWRGAESSTVEIFRNGALLDITGNDGKFVDRDLQAGSKSLRYRVCESNSSRCSEEISL